ncbi:MAG: hypothetical protein PHW18_06160 [Sulfuricurvum sp.]|uniref:hypothetical protein n=1 Tax=Sulfuricurvum sp. TaxID=2025608 RepID=UPI00260FDC0A|nr:hypothetical protein [Sulfuricurvum sp.]MDD2829139.1 hypothetical protein [Sulfuricurvum sp.]MDD4950188.1 hypothetical protein [Sulfuricurvum sp.]
MNVYPDLAKYIIAIVSALILLFPSIQQLLSPPMIYDWMMYCYFTLAITSLLLAILAFYLTVADQNAKPERLLGLANWTGIFSFIFLIAYFASNLYQDKTSKPTIDSFTLLPLNPKIGEKISLQAKTTSENRDNIDFEWKYNKHEVGNKEILYWKIPSNYKIYTINLCIKDQHLNQVCDNFKIDMSNENKKENNESHAK